MCAHSEELQLVVDRARGQHILQHMEIKRDMSDYASESVPISKEWNSWDARFYHEGTPGKTRNRMNVNIRGDKEFKLRWTL